MFRNSIFSFIFILSICAGAEATYRFQIVDLYGSELNHLNGDKDLASRDEDPVLLLGNSVSLVSGNYVDILRSDIPSLHIINSAVSGTGTKEMKFLAPRRFSSFKPRLVIYQVSLTANVYDIRHIVERDRISAARYYYWRAADWFLSLGYLNYRIGQMDLRWPWNHGQAEQAPVAVAGPIAFDVDQFTPTARAQVSGAPTGIDDAIFLRGSQAQDGPAIVKNIADALDYCRPGECTAIILVVPHPVQTAPIYAWRYGQLGAKFADARKLEDVDYPFIQLLKTTFADTSNVVIADPLPAMQAEEEAGIPMFLVNDFHPTHEGQETLARTLEKAMEESNMGKTPSIVISKKAS